jgi:hypothetical protein
MENQERLGTDPDSRLPSDCGSEGCGFNPRRSPKAEKQSSSLVLPGISAANDNDAHVQTSGVVSEIVADDITATVERKNPLAFAVAYQQRVCLLNHFLSVGGKVLARVLRGFPKRTPVCTVAERGINTDAPGWRVSEQPLTHALSRYVFVRTAVRT